VASIRTARGLLATGLLVTCPSAQRDVQSIVAARRWMLDPVG
jgi:hypothetical protein